MFLNIQHRVLTLLFLFQLVAVFHEDQRVGTESPRETMSNGFSSAAPSPEPMRYHSHLEYEDPNRGEIEVNEAVLKTSMSHLLYSVSVPVDVP